jgi:hypothetical protein
MSDSTTFLHTVYFWLRDGGTSEDADALAEGVRGLASIPGVLRLHVGRPAGTPRDVVDNSYAVALSVELADTAAHDAYQVHPEHERFIAEHGHLWSRVQVYDAIGSAATA